jgi:hypothetical protein
VVCCRVDTLHVLTQDAKLHCEEKFVISTASVNSLVNIGDRIYPCITPSYHPRSDADSTAKMALVVAISNLILIVPFYLSALKGFISEQIERKCPLRAGKVPYDSNTIITQGST